MTHGKDAKDGQWERAILQDVLESLPNPVFFKDLKGEFQGCNRALELFLGRDRGEILGRTVWDLFPQDEATFFAAKDEDLIRTGGRQVYKSDLRREDGAARHILFSKALWIDHAGRVSGVVCQCLDITEFREMETAHEESEARLRAALDTLQEREAQFRALFMAGNGIKLLLSPEGGWILDANPAAEAFLGYDLATLRTMSVSDFSGLGEPDLNELFGGHHQSQGEKFLRRYRLGSGEFRDVEVYAAPVEVKGKIYVWATLHDITEGRKAEAALKASEERLKSLAESIEVIVFRFERDGTCTYVNGHYERVTGLPPALVLARKWPKVLHPEDRERILEGWKAARKFEQVHETEFRLLNARDQEVWVLGRTTPERDSEGNVVSFLTTCTDITRMRRAEEALRQASKQESLGLMAGSIANDYNNILQAVWTSLDLVETFAQDPAKVTQALEWARGSLVKAKRITQYIQEYSGKGASRPQPLDLAQRVAAFAAGYALPSQSITLEVVAASNLPSVVLDPDQLDHCLRAIVANAVEALGERKGAIRILARRPGSFRASEGEWILHPQAGPAVELVVENDGPSIPRSMRHRIFDPYYTTKEEGRGLGLSSVLGIVRAHRAGLWVEGLPESGVRVRILWPVGGRVAADLAPVKEGPGAILVVDDEEDVLLVVAQLLEELVGRAVLLARCGEEAVEIIRARGETISVVLMDANMPGMDGTAAFQAIRALHPGMPGILFSGCDQEQGQELAMTYGFTDFIKKPFDVEDLGRAFRPLMPKAGD
jgi:PAS domain S-box-containing protein